MKIKSLLLLVVACIIVFSFSVSAKEFADVNEEDWFFEDVMSGVQKGYINGYEDNTFKPDGIVTLGEFYKMLVVAFNVETNTYSNPPHWAVPYSRALFENGNRNIQTIPYTLDTKMDRKNAIRDLVFLAGDIRNVVSSEYYKDEGFEDMPKSTIWSYDGYILVAKKAGVVVGDNNGNINPDEFITRAEAVTLIERALKVEKWENEDPEMLKKLNISYESEFADTFKESLCLGISKFPEELIDKFVEDGGKIVIIDETNEKYNSKSEVSGLYVASKNKIELLTHGKSASLFFDLTGTFIHEFGHYMYEYILTNAEKNELRRIFNKGIEPENLRTMTMNSYCKENVQEFWAQLVCYTLSNKSGYKDGDISESLAIATKYLSNN